MRSTAATTASRRHWLKAPWNMDGWRLDVVHMLGEAGGAE